jgi:hypothetical protein
MHSFLSKIPLIVLLGGLVGFIFFAIGRDDRIPVTEEHPTIVLTEDGFEPREITIRRGSTVTFRSTTGKQYWPASNLHPNHEIFPTFDPKRPLGPSETWTFQFDLLGTWGYHDHLRSYFVGVIHVAD